VLTAEQRRRVDRREAGVLRHLGERRAQHVAERALHALEQPRLFHARVADQQHALDA
jgi:hypothetical protein